MVTALFVRKDSVYKAMAGVDAWDAERDARNYVGGTTVIAHPPCGQWGRLRGLATRNLPEKSLAVHAVLAVRRDGGVLEHPIGSTLWKHCRLPNPGRIDKWGGFTLPVLQQWWGHKAEKATWLYICGITPSQIPPIPFVLGEAEYVITTQKRNGTGRPEVPRREREATPLAFAEFLYAIAKLAKAGLN